MKKIILTIFVMMNIISAVYFFNLGTMNVSGFWGGLFSFVVAFSAAYFPAIIFIYNYFPEEKSPKIN
ncbi:hypothetical protein [Yersinia pseudotuberculosis]|uniref:hypothetical protein n=1 Tax=Yersinia pseudotuberculosis TaxID=633 RepID=UPI001A9DC135|nr:hypothetical protein [Yersinia pseudotuberculosis]MBO1560688.1 hypothetical protein [Yersinia pseudotuberculosis]